MEIHREESMTESRNMRIGAQLYTTRELCQDLRGFSETLRRVADIGYRFVQVSGVCPYDPSWLKAELDRNGLQCVITHTAKERLINETEQVMAEHRIIGCEHVGLGYWSFEGDMSLENFMATWPAVGRRIREQGGVFMYHNHDREFQHVDGQPILQYLADRIPAEYMGFTLDTYWVQVGGADPGEWLEKLSGRVSCIHLKDCAYGQSMAALGEGNMNFDRVFEKARDAGTRYMLVEQDDCHGEDPIECLRRSYAYLRARGFE